jgi:hypothetical protein
MYQAAGHPVSDSVIVTFVNGTFSGSPNVNWWAKYTTAQMTSPLVARTGESGWKSTLFSAAGLDTVENVILRSDSLRLVLMTNEDLSNTTPTTDLAVVYDGANLAYISLYYTAGHPPGVSTLADTARAAARLVGEIDSTGGSNCTVRGFKLTKGDADTTTISESGSFAAGTYSLYTAWLWPDSVYYFRSYAVNPNGTSYGEWAHFTAASGGGGGYLIVGGRRVNTRM